MFADGSFIERRWGGCGIAYERNGHWCGRAVALGTIPDNQAAELVGVLEALLLAEQLVRPRGARRVIVLTDSMAVLKAIEAAQQSTRCHHSPHLQKILDGEVRLRDLGVEETRFTWIKGHGTSAGNRLADVLAGYGSRKSRAGHRGDRWDDPHGEDMEVCAASHRAIAAAAMR